MKSEANFTEITKSNSFVTPSLILDIVVKTRVSRKRKQQLSLQKKIIRLKHWQYLCTCPSTGTVKLPHTTRRVTSVNCDVTITKLKLFAML